MILLGLAALLVSISLAVWLLVTDEPEVDDICGDPPEEAFVITGEAPAFMNVMFDEGCDSAWAGWDD